MDISVVIPVYNSFKILETPEAERAREKLENMDMEKIEYN